MACFFPGAMPSKAPAVSCKEMVLPRNTRLWTLKE